MRRLVPRILVLPTLAFAALTASAPSLAGPDNSARWATVIGIVQANNVVGPVQGGGQPWSTLGGNVTVDLAHGRIDFDVRGLVFAGGNAIGTPGPIRRSRARSSATSMAAPERPRWWTPRSSRSTTKATRAFTAASEPCLRRARAEPDIAFLIRIPAGRWIANGAVLR